MSNKTKTTALALTKTTALTSANAAPTTQAQVAVNIDLFGLKLLAGYEYREDGQTITVFMKDDPAGPTKIKVSEIASRFNSDVKKIDKDAPVDLKLKFDWPDSVKQKVNDLTITVNQVYFYMFIPKKGSGANDDPVKKIKVEYAFSIDIDKFPKQDFPISVDSVGIRFWKTNNKEVIKSLKLIDFNKYKPEEEEKKD